MLYELVSANFLPEIAYLEKGGKVKRLSFELICSLKKIFLLIYLLV